MITVARLEFPSRSTPFVKFVGGIGNVQSQVRPENKTNEKSVSIKSKKSFICIEMVFFMTLIQTHHHVQNKIKIKPTILEERTCLEIDGIPI